MGTWSAVDPVAWRDGWVPRLQLLAGAGRETPCGSWQATAATLSCSYNLSCELEPPSESASNTLKAKKNTAIVKRWSE